MSHPKLHCYMRISDSDGPFPGVVRRHVRAKLHAEERVQKLTLIGTLIGTPGQQMSIETIDHDDLNLSDQDQAEVLLQLHDQIHRNDSERVTSSVTDFEVETADCLVLAKIADDLATAVWR